MFRHFSPVGAERLDLLLLVLAQVVDLLLGVLGAVGLVGDVDDRSQPSRASSVTSSGVPVSAELLKASLLLSKSSPDLPSAWNASQKSVSDASSGASPPQPCQDAGHQDQPGPHRVRCPLSIR